MLIEQWRRFYNTKRPHSSLGYCPPRPKRYFLKSHRWLKLKLRSDSNSQAGPINEPRSKAVDHAAMKYVDILPQPFSKYFDHHNADSFLCKGFCHGTVGLEYIDA